MYAPQASFSESLATAVPEYPVGPGPQNTSISMNSNRSRVGGLFRREMAPKRAAEK
jgi:hypothetical protein